MKRRAPRTVRRRPDLAAVRFDVAFQPAMVIVKADGRIETLAGAVDETLLTQIISESI